MVSVELVILFLESVMYLNWHWPPPGAGCPTKSCLVEGMFECGCYEKNVRKPQKGPESISGVQNTPAPPFSLTVSSTWTWSSLAPYILTITSPKMPFPGDCQPTWLHSANPTCRSEQTYWLLTIQAFHAAGNKQSYWYKSTYKTLSYPPPSVFPNPLMQTAPSLPSLWD